MTSPAEALKVLDEMRAALYDKPQDKRFPVNVSLDELNAIHACMSAQQAGWPLPVPLPWDRDYDCFNIGDKVAVYFDDHGGWYFGEVKSGYRHHDGCVSYRLNDIGPQEKGFWGSGYAVPSVLLLSEYEYLRANPEYYKWWRRAAGNSSYNGKHIHLSETLPSPPAAKPDSGGGDD